MIIVAPDLWKVLVWIGKTFHRRVSVVGPRRLTVVSSTHDWSYPGEMPEENLRSGIACTTQAALEQVAGFNGSASKRVFSDHRVGLIGRERASSPRV